MKWGECRTRSPFSWICFPRPVSQLRAFPEVSAGASLRSDWWLLWFVAPVWLRALVSVVLPFVYSWSVQVLWQAARDKKNKKNYMRLNYIRLKTNIKVNKSWRENKQNQNIQSSLCPQVDLRLKGLNGVFACVFNNFNNLTPIKSSFMLLSEVFLYAEREKY